MRTLVPVLALALSLASCGDDGSAAPDRPGARVRLWELPHGRLEEPAGDRRDAETLLHEDFADLTRLGWRPVVDPERPLESNDGSLRIESAGDGSPGVRLGGSHGGLWTTVDAAPDTVYELTVAVRTDELTPSDEAGFVGGTFFIGELVRAGPPEEVLAEGMDPVVGARHFLASTTGTSAGRTKRTLVFRTGHETRALLLAGLLALPTPVLGGTVEFTDLRLATVSGRRLLEDLRRQAAGERTAGVVPPDASPGDWRARTLVRERIFGESRHALALLPGERLELALVVPAGGPRLEFVLAPFTRALAAGSRAKRGRLAVAVGGEHALAASVAPSASALDARWERHELDLGRYAGEPVTLSFAVEGDLPLLVGTPVVRDASRRQPGPNVLLISIDTLRADHLSCYGYGRATTPNLDALAARGLLALDCTAQAPYTLPSHVTLFSGQPPSVHGVQAAGTSISPGRTPLLASLLADAGLRTRAFTAGGYVNPVFGFDRGFDAYSNVDPYRDDDSPHIRTLLASDPESFDEALFEAFGPERVLDWVEDNADERWFLFLHTYTVHDFDPPPGWTERFPVDVEPTLEDFQPYFDYAYAREHGIPEGDRLNILRHYDAALAYVDQELGRLFAHLAELGLDDETIVLVTSDHGKEIGERGTITHGVTLYEELTRVPLIVYVPGRAPRILERPAMLVDVAPTLLGAVGLPVDPRMQGLDLYGDVPPRAVWSEVVQPPLAHRYALRDPGGLKVLHDPAEFEQLFPAPRPWELFALDDDPGEERDLARQAEAAGRLGRMQARLARERARLEAAGAALGELGDGTLDASTREQLEALGYFGHER